MPAERRTPGPPPPGVPGTPGSPGSPGSGSPGSGTPGSGSPGPGTPDEPPNRLRGVLVALAAVGLGVGVLAVLPSRSGASGRSASSTRSGAPAHSGSGSGGGTTTTTSTTAPGSGGSGSGSGGSTTTTAAAATVHVALLAPSGAPDGPTLQQKLSSSSFTLVPHSPIPSSWVSALTAPLVRYPSGYQSEAATVSSALGLAASAAQAEPSGTSVGADVIEVFVPTTATG